MNKIESIVMKYVAFATDYREATLGSDYIKANKCYKKITECYCKLKDLQAVSSLKDLLQHENESVVVWASLHLLPYESKIAEDALARIAKKGGLIAFDAEMTLKEWKAGRLKIV